MLIDILTMNKPTLRSHTHLQFAQTNPQTKNCKRVCLPNRTDTTNLDRQTTSEKEGRILSFFCLKILKNKLKLKA